MDKIKAVALLSGGLDSTLATKLMVDMGFEVVALNFITPFCTCTRKGCRHEASRVAREFGIEIKIINAGEEYIKMVKNPKYGYGKNMNPCIDCRIFMLKKAREFMREEKASFLFTGEVLSQRPMSQRKNPMRLIEKESNLEGFILRPLSANLLEPTIPEKKGLVDREKMLEISGRSRKPQISLARELNIRDYPCPAGGCRLTDPNFARRIKDSFEYNEYSIKDIMLLRYGRHFRLPSGCKIVVGRNKEENKKIEAFAGEDNLLLEVVGWKGPITLIKGNFDDTDVKFAAEVCAGYSKCGDIEVKVQIRHTIGREKVLNVKPVRHEKVEPYLV